MTGPSNDNEIREEKNLLQTVSSVFCQEVSHT